MKIEIRIGVVVFIFITLLFNSIQASAQFAVIYEGRYSYDAIAHIDDDVIYKGRYGYDAIFHIDDNVIYKGRYGYDAVAHFDDGVLYKGKYGYDAILHIDGHLTKLQLFAILLINLVY